MIWPAAFRLVVPAALLMSAVDFWTGSSGVLSNLLGGACAVVALAIVRHS